MRIKTLKFNTEHQKTIFWALAGAAFVFILLYSYFVNASVLSVVERKNIEQELAISSSRVAGLESKYFASMNSITLAFAIESGFVETQTNTFVARKALARNILTLNNSDSQ